jgi:hypothetical protein
MKMKTIKLSVLACAALVTGLISCSEKGGNSSLPAVSKTDSIAAPFSTTKPFTYFSFKNDAIVSGTDSATTNWDFAFRFVNIIVNSHASGPGNVGVITQSGIYESFMQAPATGYGFDTTTTQLAINARDRDANAWYLYDPSVHALTPKAGKFFVFRTTDNKYVKMEILSVTTDVPFTNPIPPDTIWYKFRYAYQADGSRNF